MSSSIDWGSVVVAVAPVAGELGGMVLDIIRAKADPLATLKRLRAMVPMVAVAASTGATEETEDEWAARMRAAFGSG